MEPDKLAIGTPDPAGSGVPSIVRSNEYRANAARNRPKARDVPDILASTRTLADRLVSAPNPTNGTDHLDQGGSAMVAVGGQAAHELFTQSAFLSRSGEVQLFWVNGEMCDLLQRAAKELPDEQRPLDAVRRPPLHGFVVFERPLASWAAKEEDGLPVMIRGLGWVGVVSNRWDGVPRQTVAIIPFGLEYRGLNGGLCPLSSSYLFPHATLSEHLANDALGGGEPFSDEHAEDRRLTLALLALLESTVVSSTAERTYRAAAKRADRADLPSDVRIIQLRRARHAGSGEPGTPEYVDWSHRWIVSGHWRNQACGPDHKDRRLTWVSPYVKGPEHKPLIVRPTVGALVR